MNREGGAQGSCWFWWKTAEHPSVVWAVVFVNWPSWNRQTCWKSVQKNFTEAKGSLSQQHQLVHWYRWVSRTLIKWGKPLLWGAYPPEVYVILRGPPRIGVFILWYITEVFKLRLVHFSMYVFTFSIYFYLKKQK